MNRVIWIEQDRESFFEEYKSACRHGWTTLAAQLSISPRTLLSWRKGFSKMPEASLLTILHQQPGIARPNYTILDEKTARSAASRVGGLARAAKYGSPATSAGRKKGGLRAMSVMRSKNTGFIFEKPVRQPTIDVRLAEFIGLISGDGHVDRYQVIIYGCESTDSAYKDYVSDLGKALFSLEAKISQRKNQDCWMVAFSSIGLVKLLKKFGVSQGNKVRQGIRIPEWVKANPGLTVGFLRGIFDTDGCVFLDSHKVGSKTYRNLGVSITSYSPKLLEDIHEGLHSLGFSPTISKSHQVYLRKRQDVDAFFSKISPNNEKHWSRYRKYKDIRGEVLELVEQAGLENR